MNHTDPAQARRAVADPLPDERAWPLIWGHAPYPLPARVSYRAPYADPYSTAVERFLVTVTRPMVRSEIPDPVNRPWLSPAVLATGPDPNVAYHARRTLTLVLEVWARRRPPTHLDRLLEQPAARYTHVVAVRMKARNIHSARLYAMRICHPHPDAAEVAAVCLINQRPRALAARFERCAEGPAWRCQALQLG